MLRKISIALLLGLGVFLCTAGCEEEKSVQAGRAGSPNPTARPVNNQPGKSPPLPAPATTTRPASSAKAPAPEAPPSAGPIPIRRKRKPAKQAKAAISQKASKKTEKDKTHSVRNIELTREQFQLFDTLRQNSLKLQMKLDEFRERNDRLTRALVDSRETGRQLQDTLRRSTIVQEIQKRELLEFKDRVGQGSAVGDTSAKSKTSARPGGAKKSPVDLMDEVRRLRRKNEKLQLQLQLAQLDAPDTRQKVLLKLGKVTERNETLETLNRKLSHMVVEQDGQIKTFQKRETEFRNRQADHAAQMARMERERRKQLAARELKLAEVSKRIAALKTEATEKDRRIALLQKEKAIASARPVSAPPKPTPPAKAKPAMVAAVKADPVPAVAPQPPAVSATPKVNAPISGKITALKGLMVMVDIGSDQGLEDGMRLIVYREDKFIGYLRVEKTNRSESACTFTRQILRPKLGDNVIDRLE